MRLNGVVQAFLQPRLPITGLIIPRTSYICSTCRSFQTTTTLNAGARKKRPRLRVSPKAEDEWIERKVKAWIEAPNTAAGSARSLIRYTEAAENYHAWWVECSLTPRMQGWQIDKDVLTGLWRWLVDNEKAGKKEFLEALKAFGIPLEACLPLGRALFQGSQNDGPRVELSKDNRAMEDAGLRWLAAQLLFHASAAGSTYATCYIVKRAFSQKNWDQPEIQKELVRLEGIAEVDKHPAAMVVTAKWYSMNEKYDQAVEMLKGAAEQSKLREEENSDTWFGRDQTTPDEDVAGLSHGGKALRDLGNLYLNVYDDRAKAEEAWSQAAYDHDDASSYTYLSTILSDKKKYSKEWFHHTLKAATGAHIESMYEIGKLYMSCLDKTKRQEIMDAGLAEEINHVMYGEKHSLLRGLWESADAGVVEQARASIGVKEVDFPLFEDEDETAFATNRLVQMAKMWLQYAASRNHAPSLLAEARLAWTMGDAYQAAQSLCRATLEKAGDTRVWPGAVQEYSLMYNALMASSQGKWEYDREMEAINYKAKMAQQPAHVSKQTINADPGFVDWF